MPTYTHFSGDIGDLEDIEGNAWNYPLNNGTVVDNSSQETSLSLLRRLQLKLFGYAYIGHRRRQGWKGPLPFYAFNCGVHGLVEDYPHGYNKRLDCPLCLREDILIRTRSKMEK